MNYENFPDMYDAKPGVIVQLLRSSILKYLDTEIRAHWPKLLDYVEGYRLDPAVKGVKGMMAFFFHKNAIIYWDANWQKVSPTKFVISAAFELQKGQQKASLLFGIRLQGEPGHRKWVLLG